MSDQNVKITKASVPFNVDQAEDDGLDTYSSESTPSVSSNFGPGTSRYARASISNSEWNNLLGGAPQSQIVPMLPNDEFASQLTMLADFLGETRIEEENASPLPVLSRNIPIPNSIFQVNRMIYESIDPAENPDVKREEMKTIPKIGKAIDIYRASGNNKSYAVQYTKTRVGMLAEMKERLKNEIDALMKSEIVDGHLLNRNMRRLALLTDKSDEAVRQYIEAKNLPGTSNVE